MGSATVTVAELAVLAKDHADSVVARDCRQLSTQFVRQPTVLMIEEGDPLAACCGNTAIAGRRVAGGLLSKVNEALAQGLALSQSFAQVVIRPVIDEDQFEVLDALSEHTDQGLVQVLRIVVRGHHDGDSRREHGVRLASSVACMSCDLSAYAASGMPVIGDKWRPSPAWPWPG